jgi:hypothetical protein
MAVPPQAAPGPAQPGGMQRIPFPTESYTHASKPLNQKRLVNYYAEAEPQDSRTAAALIPTAGLVQFENFVCGAGPVTVLNTDRPGILYAVSGSHFYRATNPFGTTSLVVEDLGNIGAPSPSDYNFNLMVTVAVGVNSAVVCVPPKAFTCTDTGPLNQITGTFPGATSVTYIDGYYVFTGASYDAKFFISYLLDPTQFNALDFAFADAVPNVIRRVVTLRDELWIIGDKAIEVWYDSGDADFPFRRRSGGLISIGCDSIRTVAIADNSLFWVGDEGHVFRSTGYRAERISTFAVEEGLRAAGTNSVVCGFTFSLNGHTFYCVTYFTRTWCYDLSTKSWHDRSSGGVDSAWFVLCAGDFRFTPMFGTSASGRVLTPDPGVATEDGAPMSRLVQLPPLWADTRRGFCARLEIEADVGVALSAPTVLLQWSDDGGYTWTTGRTLSINQAANYRQRLVATRLGSFRQRMFRLSLGGRTTLYGIDADISPGAH